MNINLELLKQTGLFKNMISAEINEIFSKIQIIEKTYKKGAILLIQDTKYIDMFIIIKGTGYAEMLDYSGKAVKIEDIHAPYIVASAVLFAEDSTLPVSLTAKTDISAIIIKKEQILKLCLTNRHFLNNILTDISNKFSFISKRLSILAFKSIKEKIACYFLSLKKDKDGTIKLPVNLEEIADYLAVARPSLSRLLMRLEEEKIIRREGKTVTILDHDKLIG